MIEDLHFHSMFWIEGTVFSFGGGDLGTLLGCSVSSTGSAWALFRFVPLQTL